MGGGSPGQHLLCLLPWPEPAGVLDGIRKQYPDLKATYIQTVDGKHKDLTDDTYKDVTILATLGTLPPKPELAPNLGFANRAQELVQLWSAGTDKLVKHPIYTSTSIPLATASGIHGPQIAEWVLMTMLVSSHYFRLTNSWQEARRWGNGYSGNSPLQLTRDSVGQRVGVLGYGSIGRQVARVAQAMGMDTIAFTASPRTSPESKKDRGFIVPGTGDPDGTIPRAWYSGLDKASLHEFLRQEIDVLVVAVPLTEQTHHLLGAEEMEILSQRNTFVSNISRGKIIDQAALIAALHAFADDDGSGGGKRPPIPGQGRKGLRGAALDVTDPEPLPEGHELFSTPNCIVTPHISGITREYTERAFQVLQANLERRAKGEKLINIVDRKKGY